MVDKFDPDAYLAEKKETPAEGDSSSSPASMGMGDVVTSAIGNLPASAARFGHDIIQPFIHPIDTAESIKNLGMGLMEKFARHAQAGYAKADPNAVPEYGEHEKYAEAVGKFLADRYGGVENVKKTLAEDPVGLAADLSMLLTGGGSAVARVPGIAGKVGEVARAVGSTIDPVNAATKGAGLAAKGITGFIGDVGTHTGGEAMRLGASAGYEGGAPAKAFRENIRAQEPLEHTVEAAHEAISNMKRERGFAYEQAMRSSGLDRVLLDFDKIDNAFDRVAGVKKWQGIDISSKTAAVRKEMRDTIDLWKDYANYGGPQFRSAEAFDKLKQQLGEIWDSYKSEFRGSPQEKIAGEVYHAVRRSIIDQAPKYGRIMEAYEKASGQIREIEKTLSIRPNATIDTSLRKLQSVLRDNVNTSFGRRKELAEFLVESGAPHLMERLAGQTMRAPFARGLGRLGIMLAVEGGLATLGIGGHISRAPLWMAAGIPFMSPRLMGEASYYAGRAVSPLKYVPKPNPTASFQVGRIPRMEQEEENP